MVALVRLSDTADEVFFEGDLTAQAIREISVSDELGDYVASIGASASALSSTVKTVLSATAATAVEIMTSKEDGGRLSSLEVEFGLKV